jgi:hypothetical protein
MMSTAEYRNAWQRRKYRNDPDFRASKLKASRESHRDARSSPAYRRLCTVRDAISRKRASIQAHLLRVAEHEQDLFALIAERDQLAAEWKAARKGSEK